MEEKSLQHASQPLLTVQRLDPHCLSGFLSPPASLWMSSLHAGWYSRCDLMCTVERGQSLPGSGAVLYPMPRQCCPPLLPMCMAGHLHPSGPSPRAAAWPCWPQPAPHGVLPFWERHSCWQISVMAPWPAGMPSSINTIQQQLFWMWITMSKIVMWTKLCCSQKVQ